MRTKFLVVAATIFALTLCLLPVSSARQTAGSRMGKKEIAEQWQKLRKKGWSRGEMGAALELARYRRGLFDIVVDMKGKVPMSALQKSFQVCEGNPELVREFWDYVLKHNFPPKEVARVISKFPPNKQQRWLYFQYRAGGAKQLEQRGKKKEEQGSRKRRERPEGYSANEVWKVFQGVRFDVGLVKKYFSLREEGASPPKAWAEVKKEVQADLEKEKQAAEKKRKEEEKKRREKEEARRKMQEEARKKHAEKEGKDDEKEEKAETISLEGLGNLVGEEKKETPEEKKDTETGKGTKPEEKHEDNAKKEEDGNGSSGADDDGGQKDETEN